MQKAMFIMMGSMMMAAISPGCAANSRSMAGRLLNGATSVASVVPLSTPALDTTGVGFSGSPNSLPLGLRRGQLLEGVHLRLVVEEIRGRDRVSALMQGHHQAARVAIRQRLQQDRVDHAEYGRIRADTQRQHQNSRKRKPRTLD